MADFKKLTLVLAMAGLLSNGAVQAALHDRGGGLIYDDVLDITWLADTRYARTSGYDSDDRMDFSAANTWAANLVYHDNVRNVDYDDWRLPTALNQDGTGPCLGPYCTGSEMGHMYFNNLGATFVSYVEFYDGPTNNYWGLTNTANVELFTWDTGVNDFWTSTVYAPDQDQGNSLWGSDPANSAWFFAHFFYLWQEIGHFAKSQQDQSSSWAVRPGDVAIAVPEPESYVMLLAGLGLFGLMARRRKVSTI